MGRSKVEEDKIEASICPDCSYEHIVVPMFKVHGDIFHCIVCRVTYKKKVNGKTIFVPIENKDILFTADFEI